MHPAVAFARAPRRPTRSDLLITAAVALWAVMEALFLEGPGEPWQRFLVALGLSLPLLFRRRAPAAVMLTVGGLLLGWAIFSDGTEEGAVPFACLLIATFSVGVHVRSTPLAIALGLVPIALMAAMSQTDFYANAEQESAADYVILPFFVVGAWGAGRLVRRRASQLAAVEAESGELARAAVAAERARIARELHDVVAHSVSIVAVQAGAAQELVERDPAGAREHMDAVRRTAQDALREMRRLLSVLREDEASYAPQPTLGRLGELVAEARAAGVPVSLEEHGARGAIPPGVDLTAYRVVQEALTNVRKHAGAAPTRVHVTYEPGAIALEIVNAGGAGGNGGGSGYGLIGMRERVRVYGGTVDAGPEPDGGFAVRARLPIEVAPA
jgi:signal transduction histidine kinase